MKAQSFEKTEMYATTIDIKENGLQSPTYLVNLVRSGGLPEKLTTIAINDSEPFEDIFITTLENPGLAGISEVIKMDIESVTCCAEVVTYYFMVTDQKKLISLPELTNIYCENSDTDSQYTFPNQLFGIKNKIVQTETLYSESTEIKYVSLQQSFILNNDKIDSSKSTALTGY
ncbi:hypothetical protein GCM10022393_24660 [Aquimarina addita]|uniref:Uncharacterized protein n=2 Tax=Aquimarina addita TaxID=870485 RepID=A0ABP6UMS1_9FLAO